MARKITVWLCAGAIIWLAGFGWFMHEIHKQLPQESAEKTDAIVVLTGGPGRLEYGMRLLMEGKGAKLFVSGVGDQVTLRELMLQLPANMQNGASPFARQITLGYEAENTIGNATEIAQWVQKNRIQSVRLVTADYHMPRSLVEFSQAMPALRILPCPVTTDEFSIFEWWQHKESRVRLLSEYHKYWAGKMRHALVSIGI